MQYTLSTLKAAIVEAAIASHLDALTGVTDANSFAKAVRQAFPQSYWDFRTYAGWLKMADWLGVDAENWIKCRGVKEDQGESLKDLKDKVRKHYTVADTQALKIKLTEWGVPFTDLRYRRSWKKLWDEVQVHYLAAA